MKFLVHLQQFGGFVALDHAGALRQDRVFECSHQYTIIYTRDIYFHIFRGNQDIKPISRFIVINLNEPYTKWAEVANIVLTNAVNEIMRLLLTHSVHIIQIKEKYGKPFNSLPPLPFFSFFFCQIFSPCSSTGFCLIQWFLSWRIY